MIWIWVAAGGAVLGFILVQLRLVPPPLAATLIRIRDGSIGLSRGQLLPHAKAQVEDILREASVSGGFIAVTRYKRVLFSRQIPETIHQRLRNVILNQ